MGRRIFIVAFWIVTSRLCIPLHAQQFSVRKYTAVDGLPQSEVRAMVEDHNGYLWIATQGGGLARFDGREFKVYTTLDGLLSNVVTTLFIDSKNNIWMAHPRGITKYDGRTFKKFLQPAGTGSKRIRRIFEQGDSILFVSNPGVIGKIIDDSVYYWNKPIIPNKTIFFTYVKQGRSIVHYLNDSSFLCLVGGQTKIISHKNIFGQAKHIFSMGREIVVSSEEGYYQLDLINNKLIPKEINIFKHIVFYDSSNHVFWTRSENKLFKEYMVDGKLKEELVYDGLEISQVLTDGEGNTWIGSMGDGLIRHFNQDFERCISDKLKVVMAIAKDHDDAYWIGSAHKTGLWRMAKGKNKVYTLPNKLNDWVSSIKVTSNGTVFAASRLALGMYNKPTDSFRWMSRIDGLSNSYVSAIEPDDKNGLWVGTVMGGLNYFDGQKFSLVADDQNLKAKNISALKFMPASKSLFIGTDYGLSELSSDGKMKSIRLPEFDNATIYSLNSYQDSLLLIGSGGAGFAVYDPKSKNKKNITPKDGLTSGFVFFVVSDEKNQIWIGTVKGITRIKLNNQWDIEESLHYGFDNGLTGIETNHNAFYISEDEKYFGLIDGLYQFNDLDAENFKSFATHLTGVEILFGQEEIKKYGTQPAGFFKIPENLSVPNRLNHLTFHFNRVDKRNPKSVQYKYYLENFDKTWSHPTTTNEVTYGSLPPGQYIFKVIATNKNGSWEAVPLSYAFVVQAPFYQTAWFISFMVLVLIGAISYIVMYRVRSRVAKVMEVENIRQKEQESLRKEIARDFHDEMGNQLTRIINYVSLLKLTANGNGANGHGEKENGLASHNHLNGLGELFNKVEASAKNLYTGTRDFIWAIDPVNDELSQLFIHLRDFGVKLFEEKNIDFRANNHVRDSVKLPYGFSREANLIFKEAMTNAFKHSQAKNIALTLHKVDEDFLLDLTDDGVGFSYSAITMNGLKNIRGRAERIKANLALEGAPGRGTKVVLSFNFHKKQKQYVKL